jgi:hypothetical protein
MAEVKQILLTCREGAEHRLLEARLEPDGAISGRRKGRSETVRVAADQIADLQAVDETRLQPGHSYEIRSPETGEGWLAVELLELYERRNGDQIAIVRRPDGSSLGLSPGAHQWRRR